MQKKAASFSYGCFNGGCVTKLVLKDPLIFSRGMKEQYCNLENEQTVVLTSHTVDTTKFVYLTLQKQGTTKVKT